MKPAARALSVSYTGGLGDLELVGELRTYQSLFSGYGASAPFEYAIEPLGEDAYEEGVGRLVAGSPPKLQRLVVTASSNAGAVVDFIAGEKRVFGVFGSLSATASMLIKVPARVVATANVNITSGLNAGDVIDGVTLTTDDRVLLTAQTDPVQNGLWQVTGAGAAVRTADMLADDRASGSIVSIIEGSVGAASQYLCSSTAGSDVVGTDELTWTLLFPDHTHIIADVDGLQTALDAKVPSSGLNELVDDRVANLLVAGTDISLSYNDAAGTLTINSTAAGGGGASLPVNDTTSLVRDPADNTRQLRIDVGAVAAGTTRVWTAPDQNLNLNPNGTFAATSHNHTASHVTDFSEAVDDRVASLLVAGTNVSLTYDDGAGTLTINSTGGGGGSGLTYVLRNTGTSYSVAANTDLCVSNSSNFTVLFPGSPTDGDRIRVTKLLANTNWVALDLNGQTLGDGTTSIIYLRRYGATVDLVYRNSAWHFMVNGTGVKATSTELAAGTETEIRTYSPADLKSIISTNGGLLKTSTKTANYTAVAGECVIVDPSAATSDITITLPSTAAPCAVLLSAKANGRWKVLVNRNGNTVNGLTDTSLLAMRYRGQMARFWPEASGYAAQVDNPPNQLSSYNFDGSTHYAVANSAAINITGALSLACWIYPTGTGNQIIWGGYNTSSPFNGYGLSVGGSAGNDRMEIWDGTAWRAGGRAVRNKWSHVVAAYNGTNSVSWYIDGRLESVVAAGALSSYTGVKAFGGISGGSSQVNALVADWRIFNVTLTAANCQRLYNNGRGWPYDDISGCVLWYLGDEGSGSSCIDLISGNNGTVTGSGGFGPGILRL